MPFLAHQKERREIPRAIGDDLRDAACERGQHQRLPRKEHRDRLPEAGHCGCDRRVMAGGRVVEAAAYRLAHDQPDQQRREHADRSQNDEGIAPAIGRGDGSAERDAQRRPDGRAEIVEAERRAAPAGREIIGDDRVGGRHATGFAEAHRHPRRGELRVIGGDAAGHGRGAPNRAGDRQDRRPCWSCRRASRPESR